MSSFYFHLELYWISPKSELLMKVKEACSSLTFKVTSASFSFFFSRKWMQRKRKRNDAMTTAAAAYGRRRRRRRRSTQRLQQTRWCLNSNITLHFFSVSLSLLYLSTVWTWTHTHTLTYPLVHAHTHSLSSCINKTIHQAKKQGRWMEKTSSTK